MKLTVLIENTTAREDLTCEHGLSLYLETGSRRILFDAGQSGAFADNAEKLGIDLSRVDLCILSHGHYDHGGGLRRFLELNDRAPVYVSRHAFGEHWHGPEKYIGLDRTLRDSRRFIPVEGETAIAPGLTLHTDLPCRESIRAFGLTRMENGLHLPEDFLHEQYLTIVEGGRRILISGCSHRGIRNIAEHFAPDVLIGGFHLVKVTDPVELSHIAHQLLALPTFYYTGHCTGSIQYAAMKAIIGDRLHALQTGLCFEIVHLSMM